MFAFIIMALALRNSYISLNLPMSSPALQIKDIVASRLGLLVSTNALAVEVTSKWFW
jgi:hypothetical protein